jgi:ribosomal-protein-alanine N-acetyltransferase
MKFTPFPKINTERLILRRLKQSDWEMISYLRSDKIVNKFVKRPKTENKEDALKFINKINNGIDNNEWIYWSITMRDYKAFIGELIGTICLWNFSNDKKIAEVGYDLYPTFQGKGIMNEALNCVVDFGFNKLSLNKIEAFTHKDNESSIRLLKKNKFHYIKNRKDENNSDNIIFEIEKSAANNL